VTALPSSAFKILTGEEWVRFEADGRFEGSPIDLADGYIHLSAAEQVAGTLERHFAGQTGLVLAEVDLGMLGDWVRWEESRGGALFPHLYGVLPRAAVTTVRLLD
jgi:beta-hydroxylase